MSKRHKLITENQGALGIEACEGYEDLSFVIRDNGSGIFFYYKQYRAFRWE